MQTLLDLLMLYLKYSLIVLALGIVTAGGLWLWLGLASFAKQSGLDPEHNARRAVRLDPVAALRSE